MRRIRVSWKDAAFVTLVGLVLREAFSFWTGSTYDSEVWIRNAYYVAHGISPYSMMNPIPGLSFAYLNQALPSVGYLPLWSMLLAAIYDFFVLLPGYNRFVFYFLIKQPPILGDVILGRLLAKATGRWGGTPQAAQRVLTFWMLFPYPVLVSAVWGQFDALVAMIWIASLLASGPWKRSGAEGLGILLKLFPVIFVPYHFLRERGWARWRQLLVLGIPAGFTVAAFALGGWGLVSFQGTMLYEAHGVALGMTLFAVVFSQDVVSAYPSIMGLFPTVSWLWVPAVVLAGVYAVRRFSRDSQDGMVQALLLISVIFFLFHAQLYEQYLLYLLPLLLLDVVLWHPERRLLFHQTWVIGLVYMTFNNDFLIRFAVPLFPSVLDTTVALDSSPVFGVVRAWILYGLAILFVINLLQLAVVLADPKRSARPWLLRLIPRRRPKELALASGPEQPREESVR